MMMNNEPILHRQYSSTDLCRIFSFTNHHCSKRKRSNQYNDSNMQVKST